VFKRLTKFLSSIFVARAVGDEPKTPANPDRWESYLGNRGGQVALILYNVGIGDVLHGLSQKDCLIFTFALAEPGPDGLPVPDEGKVLFDMDDTFSALVASYGAHDLGRVSSAGQRGLYIAASANAQALGKALVDAAGKFHYAAKFRIEADGVAEVYALVLSPTPEERHILADEKVLRQLAASGDIAAQSRQVDHWAYFPSRESADSFGKWLGDNGFSNVEVALASRGGGGYVVRSSHEGTMLLDDVTKFTLPQHHKAVELGGSYDGWETAVMQ